MNRRSRRRRPAAVAMAVLAAAGCTGGGARNEGDRPSSAVSSIANTESALPDAGLRVVAVGDPNRRVVATGELCAIADGQTLLGCSVTRLGSETVGWLIVDGGPGGGRFQLFRGSDSVLSEFLAADDPDGRWANVQVGQAELTGDTVEELVLGFRDRGADAALEIAVVSLDPGLILRRRLANGRVTLGPAGTLTVFSATSPEGPFETYRLTVDLRDEAGGVASARFVSDHLGTLEAKDVPESEL